MSGDYWQPGQDSHGHNLDLHFLMHSAASFHAIFANQQHTVAPGLILFVAFLVFSGVSIKHGSSVIIPVTVSEEHDSRLECYGCIQTNNAKPPVMNNR